MHGNGKAGLLERTPISFNSNNVSSADMDNRLEALKVLSNSLLREIEAFRKKKNRVIPAKINLNEEVQRYEKELIRCALLRTSGKQRQAARLLNVKVTTLNSKIKRYGINPSGLTAEGEMEMPF